LHIRTFRHDEQQRRRCHAHRGTPLGIKHDPATTRRRQTSRTLCTARSVQIRPQDGMRAQAARPSCTRRRTVDISRRSAASILLEASGRIAASRRADCHDSGSLPSCHLRFVSRVEQPKSPASASSSTAFGVRSHSVSPSGACIRSGRGRSRPAASASADCRPVREHRESGSFGGKKFVSNRMRDPMYGIYTPGAKP